MEPILSKIQSQLKETLIPEFLREWLRMAGPGDLFRINCKLLSDYLELTLHETLTFFLKAVHEGVFLLSWEYHCPHCNAVPDFKHNFSELRSTAFCPLCDLNFRNILDKNIEVTFSIHPAVYVIPDAILENYKSTMINAARHRNYPLPEKFLSGLECMNNECFREFFDGQVLSVEENLEISNVTLLFTDIRGSTRMYSRLGDPKSYQIVREHFKILFAAVGRNNGTVVKTIGDAIMASFHNPADAIRAALEAQQEFNQFELEDVGFLQIKMGLHSGSVIVVNMNGKLDYFGNTVNTASRIESQAEGRTIWFSDRIYKEPEVQRYLKENRQAYNGQLRRRKTELKGIAGEFDLYYLRIREPENASGEDLLVRAVD